jgi:hypothetical protein
VVLFKKRDANVLFLQLLIGIFFEVINRVETPAAKSGRQIYKQGSEKIVLKHQGRILALEGLIAYPSTNAILIKKVDATSEIGISDEKITLQMKCKT